MNNPYATPDAVLSEPVANSATYEPKIFSIHGRIGRLRYLAYTFSATFILTFVLGILAAVLLPVLVGEHGGRSVGDLIVVAVLFYIPSILVLSIMMKRRLNDLNRAGWWGLLMLVPFVNAIFSLYLIFGAGTKGPNSYGLPPAKNSILVVIGAVFVPVVIGILTAIAISAYQQYVQRAKAAQMQQQEP